MPSNDEPPPSVWYGSPSPRGPNRKAASVGPAERQDMTKSPELWAARTSSAIAASTIPWLIVQPVLMVLFVGATIWTGGPPATQVPAWPPTTPVSLFSIPPFAAQTWGLYLLLLLVWLASTIVMACGWFSLVVGIKQSRRGSCLHLMLGVATVPALCFLAGTTLYFAIAKESGWGPRPASFHTLLVFFWVIVLVGALTSSWSVAFITRRVQIPIRSLKRGRRTAGLTAVILFVITALFTSIGVVASYGPTGSTFFNELAVQHAAWWFGSSALLFLATFISIWSSRIARRSFRTTLSLVASP